VAVNGFCYNQLPYIVTRKFVVLIAEVQEGYMPACYRPGVSHVSRDWYLEETDSFFTEV
jgi:hypothetical protein